MMIFETKTIPVEDVDETAWESLFEESFGEVPAKKPGQSLVVWGAPGTVYAWVVVECFGEYMRLAWAAVRPEFRGEGKGQDGLEVLRSLAVAMGFQNLGFVVRSDNRRMQILALKLGFEITGLVFGGGVVEISFALPLGGN
jgi:ribosomal protein S18 acetylase RimI-like enzyme